MVLIGIFCAFHGRSLCWGNHLRYICWFGSIHWYKYEVYFFTILFVSKSLCSLWSMVFWIGNCVKLLSTNMGSRGCSKWGVGVGMVGCWLGSKGGIFIIYCRRSVGRRRCWMHGMGHWGRQVGWQNSNSEVLRAVFMILVGRS